jgi:tRNA threonylcarbamoyladenosine biosynthesis protein TsaE
VPEKPENAVTRVLGAEADTCRLGDVLARALTASGDGETVLIALAGELGAGKSTLARAILRRLGVTGTIRSPTYTLAEPYTLRGGDRACHLDLYRLHDADDLEMLGFRDLLAESRLVLVEWPERVPAVRSRADLEIGLAHHDDGGRLVTFAAGTGTGRRLLDAALGAFDGAGGGTEAPPAPGDAPWSQRKSEL